MHRDLVENRKWITEEDYKEGLALAQLAPGPLAAQLSIYLGYVHYRIIGATLVGLAFVLPSFLMVIMLGYAYVKAGGLPWMQAVFYGIGAAVIGIIAVSSYKLTRKNLGRDALLWIIAMVLAISTVVTEREVLWLIIISGIVVWLCKSPPRFGSAKAIFLAPILLQITSNQISNPKLIQLGWFFLKAGAFVFGSGLAIVPFLYGGVVKEYHWLNEQQFLDAVAVAMITPGPVVITVGFIGFLVAGLAFPFFAALASFLPCYLFTVIPAPYFKKYGKRPGIASFVAGVTAAAVGAISGAVVVLGWRTLFDPEWHLDLFKLVITLVTLGIVASTKKVPEPIIVLGAALIGLVAYPLLHAS